MEIIRAYKTELDPNNKQKTIFRRCCGASRIIYNWGLAEWGYQYETGNKPSAYKLKKQFNAQKDDMCPWIRELPYCIIESEFINLGSAFQNFFRRIKNGEKEKGYPKFKKRGKKNSFQMKGYKTSSNQIWLGRSIGWVRLKERGYIPHPVAYNTNGGTVYTTISERAGRWYISVQVKEEVPEPQNYNTIVIGIDFGVNALAICSDGTVFENPKPLYNAQKKLVRLHRELSRRKNGGSNWYKTKLNIQRCYAKIANIRKHTLHQISHTLIVEKAPHVIVIEDLNVSGMTKNHHMAKAILDCGFYELRRQIEYKAQRHGVKVIIADRWYPSSKTCSQCGYIKSDLTQKDRIFRCDNCKAELDRDYNAALNLAAIGNREVHGDCLGS